MAQLTVPIVFDHDDLQRMVNEKIEEVKAQFIPKADYENRLKADLVAILTEIQLEFEEIETGGDAWELAIKDDCINLIQQKIDKLKEVKE